MSSDRAVIIYSGGMDSFTLLSELYHRGIKLFAVSFDYGQRHVKELDYAKGYCLSLGVDHTTVDMRSVGQSLLFGSQQYGSTLTSARPVPLGHYAEESMKQTVVPNRNMIMLSMAVGYAVSLEAPKVYTAVHAGDHAIYPDCRPAFIEAMNAVTRIANYIPVEIAAPYLDIDKGSILARGLALNLDYGFSWTCYNGRERACGKCGACTERLEAFTVNGATDPLAYEEAA